MRSEASDPRSLKFLLRRWLGLGQAAGRSSQVVALGVRTESAAILRRGSSQTFLITTVTGWRSLSRLRRRDRLGWVMCWVEELAGWVIFKPSDFKNIVFTIFCVAWRVFFACAVKSINILINDNEHERCEKCRGGLKNLATPTSTPSEIRAVFCCQSCSRFPSFSDKTCDLWQNGQLDP